MTSQNWFYLGDDNIWTKFEAAIQDTIETAYLGYYAGSGGGILVVSFPGRPENYKIDFLNGTQTNMTSGKIRKIQRMGDTTTSKQSTPTTPTNDDSICIIA
eukprot:TRINITY_DN14846_c0_g2_i1.p2 TRINITY_DN14846_c0_g2~~TRINITY_DN14846_c0_g2_i1.p2  ORF type:complete len:101 (+),score=9.24 TRINITY_DN14846_c0_g2_i1:3-305(+)